VRTSPRGIKPPSLASGAPPQDGPAAWLQSAAGQRIPLGPRAAGGPGAIRDAVGLHLRAEQAGTSVEAAAFENVEQGERDRRAEGEAVEAFLLVEAALRRIGAEKGRARTERGRRGPAR
jgi:hypothetical protein